MLIQARIQYTIQYLYGNTTCVYVYPCDNSCLLAEWASDAAGKLDILGHDSDALSMDSAQISILKSPYEMSLCRFLQGNKSSRLPSVFSAQGVTLDFSYESGKGKLSD